MTKQTTADDAELVQQTFRLPRGLIRRLRVYAAQNDTTQQEVVAAALEDHLERAAGKKHS